ncbi:MAG: sulfite exporter TauE/SafE family protein [Hydrogenophilus sp.]|nr:sulfite exporter TauE/SafE family protein [Hydrogenophilus sp.]
MEYGGFVAVFLMGLLGGAHCFGMCGGIVGALVWPMGRSRGGWEQIRLVVAYNGGRVATYGALGGVAGGIGEVATVLEGVLPVQLGLYVAAQVMLVLMGLYLLGETRWLAPLERLGQRVWQIVQPVTRRFLPVEGVREAVALGMVWGLLPCGLVYGVLATALMSGSAERGALTMVAFGAGTVPNLVLAGLMWGRFRDWVQRRWVRWWAGGIVAAFGVVGLIRAPELGGQIWRGVVCHTG